MKRTYEIDSQGLRFDQFEKVEHTDILYELLRTRKHVISHSKNPTPLEHKKFCCDHPYRYWYLIFKDDFPIGSFYITNQNAIGVSVLERFSKKQKAIIKFILSNFKPLPPVPSVIPEYFHFNISLSNVSLIKTVQNLGGKKIQVTFKF